MQASFDFTPGLTVQFPLMRDLLCAIVYGSRGGLKGAAGDLDISPSELSRMLNRDQDDPRKLDVDDFVRIVYSTGDTRPSSNSRRRPAQAFRRGRSDERRRLPHEERHRRSGEARGRESPQRWTVENAGEVGPNERTARSGAAGIAAAGRRSAGEGQSMTARFTFPGRAASLRVGLLAGAEGFL